MRCEVLVDLQEGAVEVGELFGLGVCGAAGPDGFGDAGGGLEGGQEGVGGGAGDAAEFGAGDEGEAGCQGGEEVAEDDVGLLDGVDFEDEGLVEEEA